MLPATAAAQLTLGTYATVVGPTAGSSSDIVVTSGSWGASTTAPWIHLTANSGSGSGLTTLSYDASAGATRVGVITVSTGADTATLTVTQAGIAFSAQSQVTTLVGSGLNQPTA